MEGMREGRGGEGWVSKEKGRSEEKRWRRREREEGRECRYLVKGGEKEGRF